MKTELNAPSCGITSPVGFLASGVSDDPDGKKPNIAILFSECPAAIAGVFTTNRIQSAPVRLCREKLSAGRTRARAIIINSGNANACTGEEGMRDARRMAELAAELLHVDESTVFVCSTGVIGRRMNGLPDKINRLLDLVHLPVNIGQNGQCSTDSG